MLSFIDEWTRFAIVFLLKTKDETAACWEKFKAYVERLHGVKILELRCDNGGEYINDYLKESLDSDGIILTTTQPYLPQQNGIAERYNYTLFNQVRAIKHGGKISDEKSKKLSGELVSTVNYLRNLTPSSAIQNKTPYELWNNRPPTVDHLRTIWSECYMHVPKKHRKGALAARARGPLRLIGYTVAQQKVDLIVFTMNQLTKFTNLGMSRSMNQIMFRPMKRRMLTPMWSIVWSGYYSVVLTIWGRMSTW